MSQHRRSKRIVAKQSARQTDRSPAKRSQPLERVKPVKRTDKTALIGGVSALYLEDVEEIHDIVYEYSEAHEKDSTLVKTDVLLGKLPSFVRMESDEFVFRDLADLASVPRSAFRKFSIRSGGFGLTLNCGKTVCYLSAKEDDKHSIEAFDAIRAVLSRRFHPIGRFYSSWIPIQMFFVGALGAGVASIVRDDTRILSAFWLGVFLVVTLGAIWYFLIWKPRPAIVIPKYRVDAPTAWEKQRGNLIVGLLLALATAFLSALFLRWLVGTDE